MYLLLWEDRKTMLSPEHTLADSSQTQTWARTSHASGKTSFRSVIIQELKHHFQPWETAVMLPKMLQMQQTQVSLRINSGCIRMQTQVSLRNTADVLGNAIFQIYTALTIWKSSPIFREEINRDDMILVNLQQLLLHNNPWNFLILLWYGNKKQPSLLNNFESTRRQK